ncbi:FGGY-family carbohydrate kinase [Phycicoccus avicenniae]|uniref:FGGY-family carbohydrate kinase n=1 Tax=Phycicoccus avicenniae TaxID=2828860 RepID=UPI003D2D963F
MSGELVLGIDIGTGSTKGVLARPDGTVVATAVREHPDAMVMPRPDHAEMDAEAVWWGDVVAVCRELVTPDRAVAAVCVSGLGPCLLLTDADGAPVRPAILYGIDGRATAEIAEQTERFGADAVLERCGTALTTQAVGPKAAWVRRHEPDVWSRAERWFSAGSFAAFRLCGEYVLDHHTASQSVPLYDLGESGWAQDWYAEVMGHLPAPRLAWAGEVVGGVTPSASAETGLAAGTPVCAGTVDAWAEAYGAGVRATGDLMLMYGSTMFFVQELAGPAPHPQLWNTRGVRPGTTSLAAGMSTSGSLTAWVRDLTGGTPFETLVAEAAAVPPGSDGLLLLPYFAGERTPIFDTDARGVVAGLTLRHRRGHLYRAAYEGIAFGIRQILELLDTEADPVRRLVAVGGGTRGGLWTQVVSDVTGRHQDVPAQTVGASYGDALLAAQAVGLVAAEADWASVATTVEPQAAHAEVYDELYAAYLALYPATRDVAHLLAGLQQRGAGAAVGGRP